MSTPGPETHRLLVPAGPGGVPETSDWIRACAAASALSPDDTYRLDLCAGEIVTNIVDYAFAGIPESGIEIALSIGHASATLHIDDPGQPFDPLAHLAHAPPRAPDDAPGGWGLRLVETFADAWHYERTGGRNRTTLRFDLTRAADMSAAADGTTTTRQGNVEPPTVAAATSESSPGTAWPQSGQAAGWAPRHLEQLARLDIFRGAPLPLVESALADCTIVTFREDTVLLRPGDCNEVVAFVLDGRLRVYLDSLEDPDFVSIDPGRLVGELSVIDGDPVSAFVVADAGTHLLLVDQDTLFGKLLPVPEVSRNFMRMLTNRVRKTSERIVGQLRAAHAWEQLQRDLRVAHDIQIGMLPDAASLFPDRHDIEFAAGIRVAQEVGGDFYDAFFLDEHHLFVAIGDVCGKGLPAALFMVRALTLLRSEATSRSGSRLRPLPQVIERVNAQLLERNEASLFVTIFCAVLDTRTGRLVHVNAGHNAPVLVSPDGTAGFLEVRRNPVVGILGGLRFEASELVLAPGTTLFLYTDGATEAESAAGELFGTDRLLAAVGDTSARDARTISDRTFASVLEFSRDTVQSDDITLVAVRYVGSTRAVRDAAQR